MTSMDFLSWLKDWLVRHPLKTPSGSPRASYTEDVMARVRAAQEPSPVLQWLPKPRGAFRLGMGFAGVVALVVLVNRTPPQLAQQIKQDWQLLSEIGEDSLEFDTRDLGEEAQTVDQLMLAEALPEDDEIVWIERTTELLNGLDEEAEVNPDDETLERWLREIEWLDEEELASS